MNVGELKEILKYADDDRLVFVSSDEEGNSFRLAAVDIETIMCDQGEWIECNHEDIASGEYEGWEDEMRNAVLFW